MDDLYKVKKYAGGKEITVSVPGSKSITNRALLLAAISAKRCLLKGVLFSDDTLAMLDCLKALGFKLLINEEKKEVTVFGLAGQIPVRKATINVRSAGTAARFLVVFLSLSGGEYIIEASKQMKKRPMAQAIEILRSLGVEIKCLGKEGFFPLKITSELGKQAVPSLISVDTNISSQFASAFLLTGAIMKTGLRLLLTGERSDGAYINLTLKMMADFGIETKKDGNRYDVSQTKEFGINEYQIEPDLSAACYFYALAPLLRVNVLVKNVFLNTLQGDLKFLFLLEKIGCNLEETKAGIWVRGRHLSKYPGMIIDMQDFSDQVLTYAAIAPFAFTETKITNVAHIRKQESDRLLAAWQELTRLGVTCHLIENESGILIKPLAEELEKNFLIETYEDHRMAMAFTLIGLKTGKITIKNPACSAKTFADYFAIIDELTR
ncbi:MAG: 3-phosphoshikimate 1-carboxyvinyltransferase [Lachnospiraceae bacterium]|nr:3-phosphoshikimate 1-carboxyvinyltransferase [Lachnospiraceae bacterium]